MQSIPPLQSRKRQKGSRREAPRFQLAHGGGIRCVYGAPLTQYAAFLAGHALRAAATNCPITVEVAGRFGENRLAVYTLRNGLHGFKYDFP